MDIGFNIYGVLIEYGRTAKLWPIFAIRIGNRSAYIVAHGVDWFAPALNTREEKIVSVKIYQSVGNKGSNINVDVKTVQSLLNKKMSLLKPHLLLKVDGDCGPATIGVIKEFQRRVMKHSKPDGRIDPNGDTFAKLAESAPTESLRDSVASTFNNLLLEIQQWLKSSNTSNSEDAGASGSSLVEADYVKAANVLSVDIASVKAVARVESAGGGFLSNGKPKILFEGHQFSKRTNHKFDVSHPTLSYKKFTKLYYKGGVAEYARYEIAKSLDLKAAMMSSSWGMFQIMGFNYKLAGYGSVEEFVKAMHVSEGMHLLAFVNFLKSEKLDVHLKAKDWAAFARGYNGEEYAVNKYDKRLKQAYEAFSA